MNVHGRRVYICGSTGRQIEVSRLAYAHEVVQRLTTALAKKGGTFLLQLGKETPHDNAAQLAVHFDWTIARVAAEILASKTLPLRSTGGRLILNIVRHGSVDEVQVDPRLRLTQTRLRDADALDEVFLPRGWTSDAFGRAIFADHSDLLIAVSGGEGVEHAANAFASKGKPVIPLDLNLGASNNDGDSGATALFAKALRHHELFFKVRSGQNGANLVANTRTNIGNESVPPQDVVDAICRLIHEIVPPRAFFIRLLDDSSPADLKIVSRFFDSIVSPVVKQNGFEPFTVSIDPPEHGWVNQAIFEALHYSGMVIADVTWLRPNCLMELGYAFGNQQRVVVTARKGTELPFDLKNFDVFFWDENKSTNVEENAFRAHLNRVMDRPPIISPRRIF